MDSSTADHGARFAKHMPALVAFLRHKVGRELLACESVHDLAQSVCREVLIDIGRIELRSDDAFRSYLFLQATRKVIDRFRYHRQEKRDAARTVPLPDSSRPVEDLAVYSPLASPSHAAAAREELARVERLLQSLPEAQREAILLAKIAGVPYADLAASQGITESAVRGLVARGLARLSILLEAETRAPGG